MATTQSLHDLKASPHFVTAFVVHERNNIVQEPTSSQNQLQITVPSVGIGRKVGDLAQLALARVRAVLESPRNDDPISEKGRFAHHYVSPLFTWFGLNTRILTSASLGQVNLHDASGLEVSLVNGASHNYAGFYRSSKESEALHKLCTQLLPTHCDENSCRPLRQAMQNVVADFLNADFCAFTSTGYGSNYVAFPALASDGRVAILADSNCHNSMFTGAFLSPSASVTKFRHQDMQHLEKLLRQTATADKVIVAIEGLYSMEGDVPQLGELYRLKLRYGFVLYCDEAHSFMTLGRTGRGCLELWNDLHPESPVPQDMIDIRTATLSKSVGTIGGLIAGKLRFKDQVDRHIAELQHKDPTSLLSSTMLQTIWVLSQPTKAMFNLAYLKEVAAFCRTELRNAGVYVYGDFETPILPVWAGGPGAAARLSYEMRKAGLLASPVSTPAVPYWESRVRINLSADYRPCDVDRLVQAVIQAAEKCGIVRTSTTVRPFRPTARVEQESKQVVREASLTFLALQDLVRSCAGSEIHSTAAIDASLTSQAKFGIGAGSSRWISGTYPSHLAVENLIADRIGAETTMVYPDSTIGLAATVAALMRPVRGFSKHTVTVPRHMNKFIRDGVILGSPRGAAKAGCTIQTYQQSAELSKIIKPSSNYTKSGRHVCHTIVACVHDDRIPASSFCPEDCPSLTFSELRTLLEEAVHASSRSSTAITVLLQLPANMEILEDLSFVFKATNVHVLAFGSFESYRLPGGFLTGARKLIDELRYTSRGYMYTTSTPPFVMDMIHTMLESEQQKRCL